MPLTIACTSCGKQLRLPEAAAGQLCRCPSCHGTFTVVENAGRLSVQPSQRDIPEVLPVVLPDCSADDIPDWLAPAAAAYYTVSDYTVAGAERLMRALTGQPGMAVCQFYSGRQACQIQYFRLSGVLTGQPGTAVCQFYSGRQLFQSRCYQAKSPLT